MFTKLQKTDGEIAMVLSDMAIRRPAPGLLTSQSVDHTNALTQISAQILHLVWVRNAIARLVLIYRLAQQSTLLQHMQKCIIIDFRYTPLISMGPLLIRVFTSIGREQPAVQFQPRLVVQHP